jgi:hypothetical protein
MHESRDHATSLQVLYCYWVTWPLLRDLLVRLRITAPELWQCGSHAVYELCSTSWE